MPTMNHGNIYTSPYRSFNFQQLILIIISIIILLTRFLKNLLLHIAITFLEVYSPIHYTVDRIL